MVDPWSGAVVGVLTQIVGEVTSDLLESIARTSGGVGLVGQPVRVEPRRPEAWRARRLGASELDRLVAGLNSRMAGLRAGLGREIPDHEWAAAVEAVRVSLARAAPVDASLVLMQARLDPERLEALVGRVSADVVTRAALSAPAQVVYDRMLHEGCVQIVEFITSRPEFALWAHRQTVQQTAAILDHVDALPDAVARNSTQATAERHRSAREQ